MSANNRFGGGVEFEVEGVPALPIVGRAGRLVFLTTDASLYRDNGVAWERIAQKFDPPQPHATSHEDLGSDPMRGIIKVSGIEATAIPNRLGNSVNIGNIHFDPGKGTIIRSPNGQRWQIVVTNTGGVGAVLAE